MIPSYDALIKILTGLKMGTMRVQLRVPCPTCNAWGTVTTGPSEVNGTDITTDICPVCKGEKYLWQTMEVK